MYYKRKHSGFSIVDRKVINWHNKLLKRHVDEEMTTYCFVDIIR